MSFNLLSYLFSRIAFLGTHLVCMYWFNFLFNDPFNLGLNTLDFKNVVSLEKCSPIIKENLISLFVL